MKTTLDKKIASKYKKSCPNCTRNKGKEVFLSLDKFGTRIDNGKEIIQSWCRDCRSGKNPR